MTREEAITNLNMIRVAFGVPVTKEQKELVDETFEMAIQALSQEPKAEKPMCDRNICLNNEYNGIGCDECIVNKAEQQLVDRLKTERMSQAEFEQYAKEHGYIISTTNIIEQIRAEIDRLHYHPKLDFIKNDEVVDMALNIIDKYKGDKE